MPKRSDFRGFVLLELVVVGVVVLLLLTVGVPRLLELAGGFQLRLAADELVAILRLARGTAVSRGEQVGVKFFPGDGRVTYALYRDGDGDGIRTSDIETGVDSPVTPLLSLHHFVAAVRFGFPPGKPPRDPGAPHRRLGRLRDPIRFNRSDIASFGPLGESTPGSLYLTDGERLAAVRVFGRTGKVKVLIYDPAEEVWR